MTKLQSLKDKPATKRDIGKVVYWINTHGKYPVEIMEFKILQIEEDMICSDYSTAMINSPIMYWNKPVIISESELASMRDLLSRAKVIIERELCNDIEHCKDCIGNCESPKWLKDLSEVCGG